MNSHSNPDGCQFSYSPFSIPTEFKDGDGVVDQKKIEDHVMRMLGDKVRSVRVKLAYKISL